ncbi:MAG: MAPEG family protein [Pseudomonadota bacterium]
MDLLSVYPQTVTALGAMALLMLVQTLIVDVVGMRAKHVPGSTVAADHENPLFRASRAVGNTNETIAIFILGVLFCFLNGANPEHTAIAAWGFVAARGLYALCYYFNLKILRSTVFGVVLLSQLSLIVIGFRA